MSDSDTIDRLIAVGRPDLAERLKHLAGKHNQARHGWRFAKGGDDAARLGAARRSMRGRDAGERAEYRKRAGMPEAKPLERKRPKKQPVPDGVLKLASRPVGKDDKPASDKQKKYAQNLLDGAIWNTNWQVGKPPVNEAERAAWKEYASRLKLPENLTSREASALIDELRGGGDKSNMNRWMYYLRYTMKTRQAGGNLRNTDRALLIFEDANRWFLQQAYAADKSQFDWAL